MLDGVDACPMFQPVGRTDADPATAIRLVLHGGGSATQAAIANSRFVSMVDPAKPMLYIPVAMPGEVYSYSDCSRWFAGHLGPFGVERFAMWTDEDLRAKSVSDLDEFGGIYVGGGNTYKLLDTLRRTGFTPVLRASIARGIAYFGGSAGAILVGHSIATALDDEDTIGLDDLGALALLGEYLVGCHLRPEKELRFRQLAKRDQLSIIALPEDGAVSFENGHLTAVGAGDAVVKLISPDGMRSYPAGSRLIG